MRSLDDIEHEINWRKLKRRHYQEKIEVLSSLFFSKKQWRQLLIKQYEEEIDFETDRIEYLENL